MARDYSRVADFQPEHVRSPADDDKTIDRGPQLSRVGFDRFAMGLAASQMLLSVLQGKSVESPRSRDTWIAGETVRQIRKS